MRQLLLITGLWMFSVTAGAQTADQDRFILRGLSIRQALEKIVDRYDIDLVYDPQHDLSKEVYVDIRARNAEDALRAVLNRTVYDYIILSTGTYVITRRETVITDYGALSGFVFDSETGEPVQFASLYLPDASVNVSADQNGYFSIPRLLTGTYPLTVSSAGYIPQKKEIIIGNEPSSTIFRLEPSAYIGDPVIVQGSATPFNNSSWKSELSSAELAQMPSLSQPSFIRSLNFFSGLTFNYAQDILSIQGGDPSNFLMQLDGVTMYNTSRAGNPTGMFSPYAIGSIEIHKTGSDASTGGALTGQINFKHQISDRNSSSALLQADPNSMNLRAEINPDNSDWNASFTGRIRTPGQNVPYGFDASFTDWNRLDPLLQNFLMGSDSDIAHYHSAEQISDVNFNDFHLITRYKPDAFQQTEISAYFGDQSNTMDLLSERTSVASLQPQYVYSTERSYTRNIMAQVNHFRILNSKTDLNLKASMSTNSYRNGYFMTGDNQMKQDGHSTSDAFQVFRDQYRHSIPASDRSRITDLNLRGSVKRYYNNENDAEMGISVSIIDHSFALRDMFYFPLQNEQRFALIDAFYSHTFRPTDHWSFKGGLRTSTSSNNSGFYLLPRIEASYDSDKTILGYHTINLRSGIYRQFFNQFEIANIGPSALIPFHRIFTPVDNSVDPPVSYQGSMSWSVMPGDRFRFSFEAYFRHEPENLEINYLNMLTGAEVSQNSIRSQSEFLTASSLNAYGGAFTADLMLKDPQIHLQFIQQTNIARQRISGRFNDTWNHTAWSEPLSTSFLTTVPVGPSLSLLGSLKWIPVRYWAYNRAYYDFLSTHDAHSFGNVDLNDPDQHQLNDLFRLDLGIHYTRQLDRFTMKARVDLNNITNRRNEIMLMLIPSWSQQQISYTQDQRVLPGFIPTASIQFEF